MSKLKKLYKLEKITNECFSDIEKDIKGISEDLNGILENLQNYSSFKKAVWDALYDHSIDTIIEDNISFYNISGVLEELREGLYFYNDDIDTDEARELEGKIKEYNELLSSKDYYQKDSFYGVKKTIVYILNIFIDIENNIDKEDE